ncbi:hypothetical protein SDRG_06998 [Saprolegnia diclina VS20]|uniref:Uncharacterized protein n=1 Tax=Saprolegnia diclina (strain VS20) TaxID=1156394 RepID=T0QPC6_SAPDV|nr:hypothetical protein SDRG_06998 [Saprolegnia diclina VS20]EQC35720.1 hypothetical protein SDRG_06998 [Saprolegnia diclina VS20]|eukprot:XP_008611037.1 hypothetical protein SDRG_06998 [Saprolegnia diclina VS20]
MQQKLIEGFVIDHLDTPGRSATHRPSVRYDVNGRRMIPSLDMPRAKMHVPKLPSPRTIAHPIVRTTPAKRLVGAAIADLEIPTRRAQTAPAKPETTATTTFPALRSPRTEAIIDPQLLPNMSSPLATWALPREYIIEFIRLSVLPCSWAMNIKSIGEWVVAESDAPSTPTDPAVLREATQHLLPHIQVSERSPRQRPPPLVSPRRPHTLREVPFEAKVHTLLVELHANPDAWADFQAKVKEYVASKRRGRNHVDMIHENIVRVGGHPSDTRCTKPTLAQRLHKTRTKYELQLQREHEHHVELLDRHTRQVNQQKRLAARAQQVRAWLRVLCTVAHLERWHVRTRQEKSKKLLELRELAAISKIQRVWRRRVHVANSKALLHIILKTRRILWSVTFRIHCKKLGQAASVLRRFFIDYFNATDTESGNFRVLMARWRWRVINAQRASKAYIACSRARLHALGQMWDRADHDRQRTEKQLAAARSAVAVADAAPPTSPPPRRRPNRRNQAEALADLGAMQAQLLAMQSMLTPIEIQRMQTVQVVRIPKSIKMRLLVAYLMKRRAAHMRDVAAVIAKGASDAKARRGAHTKDAIALVQSGAWPTLGALSELKAKYPPFSLYSKQTNDDIKELIQEGLRLTLETDADGQRLGSDGAEVVSPPGSRGRVDSFVVRPRNV